MVFDSGLKKNAIDVKALFNNIVKSELMCFCDRSSIELRRKTTALRSIARVCDILISKKCVVVILFEEVKRKVINSRIFRYNF